jgi:hypothetical protein
LPRSDRWRQRLRARHHHIDLDLQHSARTQIAVTSRATQSRGIRNAAAILSTRATWASRRWSARRIISIVDPGAGERHAGQALAGLDAEALHLRAGFRSGRAASADRTARRADLVRALHAGEFRRPFPGADHRDRGADPQPQHPRGVGRLAAQQPDLYQFLRRRHQPHGQRKALRPGAGARRRRSDHAGTGGLYAMLANRGELSRCAARAAIRRSPARACSATRRASW